jgi:prepilin-type N-terminal cleavage/methylation domain-containing protein/prepilin-type processing-associated H-X9-DG protein
MARFRPAPCRAGFTLVELLVVIGIIALLISILLPTLSSVREGARGVACLSNLRTFASSIQFYNQDHKGYMPGSDNRDTGDNGPLTVYAGAPGISNPRNWNILMYLDQSYSQATPAYLCPEYDPSRDAANSGFQVTDENPYKTFGTSYGINAIRSFLGWRDGRLQSGNVFGHVVDFPVSDGSDVVLERDDFFWPRAAQISDPSNMLAIADAGGVGTNDPTQWKSWLALRRGNQGVEFEGMVNPRHSDRVNWLAVDGSAKSDSFEFLQQPDKPSFQFGGWNVFREY